MAKMIGTAGLMMISIFLIYTTQRMLYVNAQFDWDQCVTDCKEYCGGLNKSVCQYGCEIICAYPSPNLVKETDTKEMTPMKDRIEKAGNEELRRRKAENSESAPPPKKD